jgi:ubiquinone/menaquinone biosynthesis C-methylase UbiE
MDTRTPSLSTELPPNHHAGHPGFSGIGGAIAALSFAVGREADADLAIRLAAVGPDDDVVDIGCGPGTAARRAAVHGAYSVVGIDPAAVMLRVARILTRTSRRHGSHVRYMDGAAEALPLPDACASVVWSLATVHHWRDLDAGLAEVQRVLRAPARFVVLERRIASGASGHGWTEDQATLFAKRCCAFGFSVEVGHHQAGHKPVVTVVARRS